MPKLNDEERKLRRKLVLQRYAEKHPDRLKDSQAKYKQAHPERRKATVKKWDDANKQRRHDSYIERYYSDVEDSRKRHAVNAHNRRGKIKEIGRAHV